MRRGGRGSGCRGCPGRRRSAAACTLRALCGCGCGFSCTGRRGGLRRSGRCRRRAFFLYALAVAIVVNVPATTLENKGRLRHDTRRGCSALWTRLLALIRGAFHPLFKAMLTLGTLVFVNRHDYAKRRLLRRQPPRARPRRPHAGSYVPLAKCLHPAAPELKSVSGGREPVSRFGRMRFSQSELAHDARGLLPMQPPPKRHDP